VALQLWKIGLSAIKLKGFFHTRVRLLPSQIKFSTIDGSY